MRRPPLLARARTWGRAFLPCHVRPAAALALGRRAFVVGNVNIAIVFVV